MYPIKMNTTPSQLETLETDFDLAIDQSPKLNTDPNGREIQLNKELPLSNKVQVNADNVDLLIWFSLFLLIIYGSGVLLCWCLPKLPNLFKRFRQGDTDSRRLDHEAVRENDENVDQSLGCLSMILGNRRASRIARRRNRENRTSRHVHAYVADYHPYSCYPGAPTLDPDRKYLGATRLPSYHRSLCGSNIVLFPKTPSPNSDSLHEGLTPNFNSIIINSGSPNMESPTGTLGTTAAATADTVDVAAQTHTIGLPINIINNQLQLLQNCNTHHNGINSPLPPIYTSRVSSFENIISRLNLTYDPPPGPPPNGETGLNATTTATTTANNTNTNVCTNLQNTDVIVLVPCQGHCHVRVEGPNNPLPVTSASCSAHVLHSTSLQTVRLSELSNENLGEKSSSTGPIFDHLMPHYHHRDSYSCAVSASQSENSSGHFCEPTNTRLHSSPENSMETSLNQQILEQREGIPMITEGDVSNRLTS